jgi:hypothetical protein
MDAHLDRFHDSARRLCGIALERLPEMIDPATGLFVFRVQGSGLVPAGTSLRYTAITAIGLDRAAQCGLPCRVDIDRIHEALDATLPAAETTGDLGLVIWATAKSRPSLAERALGELAAHHDLARTRGGDHVHSTELAWLVIGLAEALSAGVGDERDVRARLDLASRRLLAQRGASGLFCFSRPLDPSRGPRTPGELLRGRLGFFDAQVYGILACLARDSVAHDPEARDAARRVGERLLAHQHPLGQWGWHYDVHTGALVDLYPVYSVHQDGMAPMALLPLERAVDLPVTNAVARGVAWLFGDNELGEPLADVDRAVIWRSVRRRAPWRRVVYPLKALHLARLGGGLDLGARLARPRLLEIDRELRPYHLGWCLLALAEIAAAHRDRRDAHVTSEPEPTLKTGELGAPEAGPGASHSP